MPNYCKNELFIEGQEKDIEEFLVSDFDFNKFLPYPEHYHQMDKEYFDIRISQDLENYISKWGTDKDGFNSGGYDWRVENWGTKWNVNKKDVKIEETDFGIKISFDTAWTPPSPVIVAMAKQFPKLDFWLEYFERGMEFCGGFRCLGSETWNDYHEDEPFKAGTITDEWEGKYKGVKGG